MILTAVFTLGVLGFVFAGLLALAAEYFQVQEDPRVSEAMKILPGANCGACGQAGCRAFAEQLAKGQAALVSCVYLGRDTAAQLARVMGLEQPGEIHKNVAAVHCGAKESQRKKKSNYFGVKTCRAANLIDSGGLVCSWGCLGYGDCFAVCPFDAIAMIDGLPEIDGKKCTACGLCVAACPRGIISIIPADFRVVVACSSHDNGALTRQACPVGCIACRICEKLAPDVFRVDDNLAVMDYTKKGINCDQAIEKCPTKCIVKL